MTSERSKPTYEVVGRTPLLAEWLDKPGHFVTRLIPCPPDVRHEVVRGPNDEISERVSLKFGCPKCHEDIEFRWEAGRADVSLVHRLYEALSLLTNDRLRLIGAIVARGEVNPEARKLGALFEELLAKLRNRLL